MDLYKELLVHILSHSDVRVTFPDIQLPVSEIVEGQSYLALQKIKEIIEDDRLIDADCFAKIEAIVSVFEELGSSGGSRHDFG